MAGQHAYLPPSGAAAWRRCSMWPTMNAAYPQDDTPESKEGTAAHWVFEQLLKGVQVTTGAMAPNGVFVTDEMVDGALLVSETVHKRMPYSSFGMRNIEQPVAIPYVHEKCWGTPDIWSFSVQTMTLEMIDYKFGHRFIDEFENDQLVTYVAGILEQIAVQLGQGAGAIDSKIIVNFTIIQPRCYYRGLPVRTWSCMASDLRGQINVLREAAELACQPNPKATTNSECVHCPGRHACDALQLAIYNDMEFATTSAPVNLSPAAASLELKMVDRALERMQARADGLREMVLSLVKSGKRVPYHRTEQLPGRKVWKLPAEQVIIMGKSLSLDLAKTSAITPTQAEKLGVNEALIEAFTHRPMGEVKLIPDNPADARRVFSQNM